MIKMLIVILSILVSIAFLTLWERKILSFTQSRKGPNLVGPLGLLQPFSDGLKLLLKENSISSVSMKMTMILAPSLMFLFMVILWGGIFEGSKLQFNLFFLFFLACSSVSVLILFFSGWGGASTYSLLGGIRASAQMISYEVVLSFLFLMPMVFTMELWNSNFEKSFFLLGAFSCIFLLLPCFFATILAETNRAPFDLTEGESELVSGFNTEYSSLPFVFLFLSEYGALLFFSMFGSLLLWGCSSYFLFLLFLFLFLRACFPRKRYDFLMNLMWSSFFPIVCVFLSLNFVIFFF